MKKKYKLRRILITLVSICAVFSMFCVPVAAAASGWGTIETTFDDQMLLESGVDLHRLVDGKVVSGGLEFPISPLYDDLQDPDSSRNITGFRLAMDFMTVAAGDTVTVYPVAGGVGGWTTNIIDSFRFIVVDSNGYDEDSRQVSDFTVGSSAYFYDFPGAGTPRTGWNFTWPQVDIKVQAPSSRAFVVLEVNVRAPIANGIISMNNKTVKIGFGNPNSPEAPNYKPPSGSDIDILGQLEDEIFTEIDSGLNEVDDLFNGSFNSLASYATSLNAVTQILGAFIDGNGALRMLIHLSLTIGIVSFLLNIVNLVADRVSTKSKSKGGA